MNLAKTVGDVHFGIKFLSCRICLGDGVMRVVWWSEVVGVKDGIEVMGVMEVNKSDETC